MSRLDQLLKDEDFLNVLDLAFDKFEEKNPKVDANKFFANLLNYKTVNEFLNHFQPHSNRYLKVDELIIILANLGESKKYVLDWLCVQYGFLCIPQIKSDQKQENFQEIFMEISYISGELAKYYQEYNKDNKLDSDEKEELNKLLYNFRTIIASYQFEDIN